MIYERVMRTGKLVRFQYSIDDSELLDYYTWRVSSHGYIVTNAPGTKKLIYFHRAALGFPKGLVDHKNGDTLDNRRCNLREVTPTQNIINSDKSRGVSGRRGVTWYAPYGKWRARITVEGKEINLGYGDTIEEAYAKRIKAEIKYFGEFRRK